VALMEFAHALSVSQNNMNIQNGDYNLILSEQASWKWHTVFISAFSSSASTHLAESRAHRNGLFPSSAWTRHSMAGSQHEHLAHLKAFARSVLSPLRAMIN
jgi:hypothetical protein